MSKSSFSLAKLNYCLACFFSTVIAGVFVTGFLTSFPALAPYTYYILGAGPLFGLLIGISAWRYWPSEVFTSPAPEVSHYFSRALFFIGVGNFVMLLGAIGLAFLLLMGIPGGSSGIPLGFAYLISMPCYLCLISVRRGLSKSKRAVASNLPLNADEQQKQLRAD